MAAAGQTPITLAEYAMLANKPLIKEATFSLYEADNVLQDLPMKTEPTIVQRGVRWTGLPGSSGNSTSLPQVNWIPLNTDPVVTSGQPVPWSENVYFVGNRFTLSKHLKNDRNQYTDPLKAMWDAWMKNFTYDFNYKFFFNDQNSGDPNAPVGIIPRLNNPDFGCPSDLNIDAGGVDMSSTMTAATANAFVSWIQQGFDHLGVQDGRGCVIYVGDVIQRAWQRGTRMMGAGGGFDMTRDAFGRDITMYRNAKVRYPGRRGDQVTQILTPWETSTGVVGTASDSTHKYCSVVIARMGEKYLSGWQMEALQPQNLGLNPLTGNSYNVAVNWGMGLIQQDIRSFVRIYDILVGQSPA